MPTAATTTLPKFHHAPSLQYSPPALHASPISPPPPSSSLASSAAAPSSPSPPARSPRRSASPSPPSSAQTTPSIFPPRPRRLILRVGQRSRDRETIRNLGLDSGPEFEKRWLAGVTLDEFIAEAQRTRPPAPPMAQRRRRRLQQQKRTKKKNSNFLILDGKQEKKKKKQKQGTRASERIAKQRQQHQHQHQHQQGRRQQPWGKNDVDEREMKCEVKMG